LNLCASLSVTVMSTVHAILLSYVVACGTNVQGCASSTSSSVN